MSRTLRLRAVAAIAAAAGLGSLVFPGTGARALETVSPAALSMAYDSGPFTAANPGGAAGQPCAAPNLCSTHGFAVSVPSGYYDSLRAAGETGVLQVTATWASAGDDFDLALLDGNGSPVAAASTHGTAFERLVYTEPAAGTYDVRLAIVHANGASVHVDVRLVPLTPAPAAALSTGNGTAPAFSAGTPVALERSTGEPHLQIAPNGDIYVDAPLTPGTNSLLYQSIDNGRTFKPLGPDHPNNNPLPTNAGGGAASATAIDADGRVCFSDLSGLTIAVGCSANDGKSFAPSNPLVLDPSTPVIGHHWAAATRQHEQFIAAQVGAASGGPSQPGLRLWKETQTPGNSVFQQVQVIDAGQSTEAFNLAVDPTDNDGGGTVVGGYLRANAGADKAQNPFQLMVWRTTDGGQSVTTHPVANLPSNPGSHFASFDVDTHGNVYAAWVEQGAWDVVYSVAKQTDLDHWTAPVRVNRLPEAATAVEPTIKVGDPGRVFIAYYGAPERANPDVRPGAEWNGYLATSVNGTCQLDATCAQPAFASSTITEHPVQYGGICLTPPACSADPYDGDGSVRRYLDVGIAPITGQVHVVLTDSSRANQGTTVTAYHQISGPSAFATGGSVKDVSGFGNSATDPDGDAIAAIQSVSFAAVAADIRKVELTRPAAGTLRVVMTMTDVTLFSQTLQQGGRQLIVGARFATEFDVFWVGFRFSFGGTREFVAGHLKANGPVDVYSPDAGITVTGTIDTGRKTITMDVPEAQLQTTLQAPKSTTTPTVVQGVVDGQALYGVTGISFVGDTAADDAVAKHWLDVAPSFSTAGAPMSPTALAAGVSPDLQARGSLADLPGAALPATGGTRGPGPVGVLLAVGLAFAALARRACSRSTQPVRSSQ